MSFILIISSEFPPGPGGIGQHAASLSLALSQHHQVLMLCNQDYSGQEEINEFNQKLPINIRLINLTARNKSFASFKRIFQAFSILGEFKPDRVLVTGRFPLWIGALLKIRYPKLSVEGFAHGTEVTALGGMLAQITYQACKKLDRVWAVSNFTSSFLKKQGLANIEILPNGLDGEFLDQSLEGAIEPFPWKGDPKFITVGNVTLRKGQHRMIKALPKILKHFPDAHYHIVGLPTKKAEFTALAESLGVGHAVTFHGRLASRNELYRAYSTADIFVMLSENQPNGDVEGFGIAILEANAFGLPAIGAKGCGIEDAIDPSSGILVDGNDTEAILNSIQQIQQDYSKYQKGARKWAEKHNWNELVKRLGIG